MLVEEVVNDRSVGDVCDVGDASRRPARGVKLVCRVGEVYEVFGIVITTQVIAKTPNDYGWMIEVPFDHLA